MMTTRYRDFDQWEAERLNEPLRFKVRGREFELPATLPALIPIRVMRLHKSAGDAEVPPDELLELALSIFGEAQLDELLATGVDMDTLGEIVGWAIGVYTGADPNVGGPEAGVEAPGRTS